MQAVIKRTKDIVNIASTVNTNHLHVSIIVELLELLCSGHNYFSSIEVCCIVFSFIRRQQIGLSGKIENSIITSEG